jgi:hypothetical protein
MAKIIRTPSRFVTICGTRPTFADFFPPAPPPPPPPPPPAIGYALNFDGVNDHIRSQTTAQGGLDFVQWERTQAWTCFIDYNPVFNSTLQFIYSSATNSDLSGLSILLLDTNRMRVSLVHNRITNNRIDVIFNPPLVAGILQITYNGSSLPIGLSVRFNDVAVPAISFSVFNLTASIIIPASKAFTIGINDPFGFPFRGILKHLSFVNYVKSVAEMSADFTAKKQSIGTGAWLLAPVEPIYKNNFSTQIKTLSVAGINAPLPNSNAFVNAQGYKMNLIGYPDPLVLGTNLIQI